MAQYGYVPGDDDGFGDSRDEGGSPLFEVNLCSGEKLPVMTAVEQRWFNDTQSKYLSQNKFDDVTDLQDLDRLLGLELMMFRWTQFLAAGQDYDRNIIDEELCRKQVKEQSDAITKLKQSLGLDKKARDAALNDGNFHVWFMDVKRRAKIFGIHRENQLNVALGLMNELSGIVGSYDRSDEEERKKLGYETEAQILAWVRESMLPRFHEVDAHFIENEQKLWKRDL
jgi:hypothetical protein